MNPNLPYANFPLPTKAEFDLMVRKAKAAMFFTKDSAFIARLLCELTIKWDETHDTAWTDGVYIGINPRLFAWLTPEERITLIAHEVWHPGYLHLLPERMKNKIHDLWNQAADHVINTMLKAQGFVFGPKLMSLKPCIDDRFHKMLTEQAYQILLEEQDPQAGGGSGSGSAGSGGSLMSNDVRPSACEKGELERKVVAAQQAAQKGKQAGSVPGETGLLLDAFLNPKLPWEILLQNWFTALAFEEESWARPNRRFDDMYMPSMEGHSGLEHLVYFWDISCSVEDEEVAQANTEVRHVHDILEPERITVITFDTKIRDIFEFERGDPFEQIEVTGRGGTDLREVYEYLVKHRPTGAVIFSDMEVAPMENPGVPVLWICTNNPDWNPEANGFDFGTVIHLSTE